MLLIASVATLSGCSLEQYRNEADEDAYSRIAEKSNDPRWTSTNIDIGIDPRSRYYDSYDPDRQPMPEDDPASHVYMHCVNCMKGWPCWHCNGDRPQLESMSWREQLADYCEMTEGGEVKLSLDSSLQLAYIHSPTFQQQLETVYLSALDVTAERFQLETQVFGGNSTRFEQEGHLRSGRLTAGRRFPGEFFPRRFPVSASRLSTDTDFQIRRNFSTAGQLLVGFANSFVWQFAGPDANTTAFSLLNFNLVQPLLRGAGQDQALERLTRVERGLLANLRQLERYRHGFYTDIATGNLGVGRVSRLGGFQGGTGLTGFSGQGQGGLGGVGAATGFGGGFGGGGAGTAGAGGGTGLAGGGAGSVGGFVGLLQSLQEIRNTQYGLDLQLRTLALLEANLAAGTIDLTQVDQFRQNIETLRAQLLQSRTGWEASLDDFKVGTLGLPPDLPVQLDDEFITQFQLIDPDITELQERIVEYQNELGSFDANNLDAFRRQLAAADGLVAAMESRYDEIDEDLRALAAKVDDRKSLMSEEEIQTFDDDMAQLIADFEKVPAAITSLKENLQQIANDLGNDSLRQIVGWARRVSDEVQSLSLIQARARLEGIVIEPIELDAPTALNIARVNRLDYMNNRAALVDTWRLIAFNADRLQSILDVELSGDLGTVGRNPIEFRSPNGSLRASLRFDAPFTRLLERNNYRQALVDYQQSRRQLIQFDDSLNQNLRQQIRNLAQLKTNLEIQRRAVIISIRRVDFTRSELNRPLPSQEPGAAPNTFGPTAVQNLLSALSDLSGAQNNFMSVWLNYYAGRMVLMRDLGIMQLDENGKWIDAPIDELLVACSPESLEIPPSVPGQWWQLSQEVDNASPTIEAPQEPELASPQETLPPEPQF